MSRAGERGYTVVELMVIIGIIMVLTAMVMANTRVGDRRQSLRDAAEQIVGAARQAEAMAAGSQTVGGQHRRAYGICISDSSLPTAKCAQGAGDVVQVYARSLTQCPLTTAVCRFDLRPSDADIITSYRLPRNVRVSNGVGTYIDYVPPIPSMRVNGGTQNIAAGSFTVGFVTGTADAYSRSIIIQPRSGAIYVQ